MLWALFLLLTILFAAERLHAPDAWPKDEFVTSWIWWAHCVLCLWIALQAPRRLADDKQSGALELLLCTPLTTRAIIRGNMQALQRRYGRVFFGLLALDTFLIYADFSSQGGWTRFRDQDSFPLSICVVLVFPLQAYAVARLGLYQGLVQTNSIRASLVTIWKVGLLPWVLFFVFMLTCDLTSRHFKWIRISDTLVFGAWAGAHIIPCTVFLLHASWCLSRKFRQLALASARRRWWERLAWVKMVTGECGEAKLRPVHR